MVPAVLLSAAGAAVALLAQTATATTSTEPPGAGAMMAASHLGSERMLAVSHLDGGPALTLPRVVRLTRPAPAGPAFATPLDAAYVSSPFGPRWGSFHEGVDLAAPTGTEVRAVMAGIVSHTVTAGGYGNLVTIDHGNGLQTRYAHLSAILVPDGPVAAGTVIGRVGSTGHSTGPHLHLELRTPAGPVDPVPFLAEHQVLPARPAG